MEHISNIMDTVSKALTSQSIDYKKFVMTTNWVLLGVDTYVLRRQQKVYSYPQPPPSLATHIPSDTFQKAQAYSRDKAAFGLFREVYGKLIGQGFVWFGVYEKFWRLSGRVLTKYLGAKYAGVIPQSLLWASLLTATSNFLGLPESYYSHFVIEEKHGFNKQTITLWITDFIKSSAITAVVGLPFLTGFLKVADYAGKNFVFYLCGFFLAFQLVFQIVYPTFIQPLFNTLAPLEEGELKTEVEKLAGSLGFPLGGLYVIDGSKRSSHSNAYFYGLPWSKHIVIFDTLIAQSSTEEVVSVLAHELGHWSLSHPTKLLVATQINLFLNLSMFTFFIHNPRLFISFGFSSQISQVEQPLAVGFTLFQLVSGVLDPLLMTGLNALTRKYEYEADKFAASLSPTIATNLQTALIKLQNKNLSSPHNDWLYSLMNHSHPTLVHRLERIQDYLGSADNKGKLEMKESEKKKEL